MNLGLPQQLVLIYHWIYSAPSGRGNLEILYSHLSQSEMKIILCHIESC